MELPESYRSFTRRTRRGVILFRMLSLAFMGLTGLALATAGYRSWAAGGFFTGLFFLLGDESRAFEVYLGVEGFGKSPDRLLGASDEAI